MYVVEKEMKEKIKKFIKTIKVFSLIGFLLDHKVKSIEKSMTLKGKMITYHQGRIKMSMIIVDVSNDAITDLQVEIRDMERKIEDIKKIK